MRDGTIVLRLGFLFPLAPTGFQFGNAFLQLPNALLAFHGLGLPLIAALLEERQQLGDRARITNIFRDGFHEQLLCAHKNLSGTKIALMTKTSSLHISPSF
jgi:hypothetical protein